VDHSLRHDAIGSVPGECGPRSGSGVTGAGYRRTFGRPVLGDINRTLDEDLATDGVRESAPFQGVALNQCAAELSRDFREPTSSRK
jgi:hypothetical protein